MKPEDQLEEQQTYLETFEKKFDVSKAVALTIGSLTNSMTAIDSPRLNSILQNLIEEMKGLPTVKDIEKAGRKANIEILNTRVEQQEELMKTLNQSKTALTGFFSSLKKW